MSLLRLLSRPPANFGKRSCRTQSQWHFHAPSGRQVFRRSVHLGLSSFPQRPRTSTAQHLPRPCRPDAHLFRRTFLTESLHPVFIPPTVFLMCFLGLWSYKIIMTIVFQNKIIYMPYMPPFARSETIEDYAKLCRPVEWQEISIRSLDGTKIALCAGEIHHATIQEAPEEHRQKRTVIIYFQGNGGSVPLRLPMLSKILKALRQTSEADVLFTLVAPSYRGFWKSKGRASQKGIERDAKATLQWVHQTYGRENCDLKVVLWGQSLGAGVATNLAALHFKSKQPAHDSTNRPKITGIILETPFIGIKEMLLALYPQKWLPYRYLWPFLRNFWDSDQALREFAASKETTDVPIQIITAGDDEVVPASQGEHLHSLCQDLELDVRRKDIVHSLHNEVPDRVAGRDAIVSFIKEVGHR